jgi:hypothetical protein
MIGAAAFTLTAGPHDAGDGSSAWQITVKKTGKGTAGRGLRPQEASIN